MALKKLIFVFNLIYAESSLAQALNTTTQMLMRQKLDSAILLLEGLIREDYSQIQKSCTNLEKISKASTWHKPDNPDFLSRAQTFQNSVQYLLEQSKAKNLEGIAMGYIRVTLDCLQCHNFVRAGRSL